LTTCRSDDWHTERGAVLSSLRKILGVVWISSTSAINGVPLRITRDDGLCAAAAGTGRE
jgi:hypothetical protein